ncbi:Serine/threonine-protein kinase AfsK [bacterium HR15]|nr:Serine/threonine-protein kinase AfsK [bacterium HR15]
MSRGTIGFLVGWLWMVAWAQTPTVTWQFFGNAARNNPAIPGLGSRTVYYPCLNRLYAINREDGTLRWQYPADAPLNATFLGQPVEGEGLVYIGASNGNVYALDAETGSLRWIFTADSAPTAIPVLDEGVLYIGTGRGEVYALNARSGEALWKEPYRAGDYIAGRIVKVGDTLFFGTNGGTVHAITAGGGRRRWAINLPSPAYDSQPIYANNSIYLTANDQLIALNPNSGSPRWTPRRFTTELRFAPAADENYVVVITRENRLYVFDHNGRLLAGDKTPVETRYEPLVAPVIHKGELWVSTRRGTLLVYTLPDLQLRWLYTLRPPEGTRDANNRPIYYLPLNRNPLFTERGLLIASDDGSLTAFTYDWLDRIPPVVLRTTPAMGEMMSGQLPLEFGARLRDDQSGINPASIQLLLDDEPLPVEYEPSTGELRAELKAGGGGTAKPLSDGRHTLTLIVSDWAGNSLRFSWGIYIDNSLRKTTPRPAGQQQPSSGTGGRGGGRGGYGGGQ